MIYDDIIVKMFKEIAAVLNLNYRKISAMHKNKIYELYNDKITFSFSVIINPYNPSEGFLPPKDLPIGIKIGGPIENQKITIISRDFSLGTYDINKLDKARNEIIVKIQKKLNK